MAAPARHSLIQRVAEIQKRERLTQGEVAARLGIDRTVYSRLLGGQVQPSVRVVQAIARAWPELHDACTAVVLGGQPAVATA